MKVRGQRVIPYDERVRNNSKVDPSTGCWNWTKSVRSEKKPYGRLMMGLSSEGTRRTIGAHQLSYLTFKGEIPPGMCVCHSCDNPRCVNPDHLFIGSKKDNADDRDRKGRNSPPPRTVTKLTQEQIDAIRKAPGGSRTIAKQVGLSHGYVRAIRRGEYLPAPPLPLTDAGG